MPFLRHYANGTSVGVIELTDRVTIGRSKRNTIVLDDLTVSGVHAEVTRRANFYVIADADSTNGIYFGNDKVDEHVFAVGDIVRVGTHEFEFLAILPEEYSKTLKIKKSWIPGIYYTE